MNKAKLIEQMAKLSKLPKASCKKALEAFTKSVLSALKAHKVVGLTDFGSFKVAKRKSRQGVNPATGKKMLIPAKWVIKFKPGKGARGTVE